MHEAAGHPAWLGEWFEDHPLAHVVFDPVTQRHLAVNRAACERYGYSAAELLAVVTRGGLLAEPAQRLELERLLATLHAGGRVDTHPVWIERHRSGTLLRSDVRSRPVQYGGRAARLAVIMDAAPRIALQQAVGEQRELWQAAAALARVGGWSWDPGADRFVASDELCALYGQPPGWRPRTAELLARHPGSEDALRRALEDGAAHGRPFDLELPFAADGGTGWARVAGAPQRSGDAAAGTRVIGVVQDIDERKRGELALADSRERLAATLRALPDLWFVFDAGGRYAEVGREDHPALGDDWSALRGRHYADVLPAAHREAFETAVARARATGEPQSYRYAMRVRSGERREFEGRCVALSDGRTLKLARDVTDLVLMQQRFRAMAEAAPVGLYEADRQGDCVYMNPQLRALLGWPAGDAGAGLGRSWLQAVHADDRERVHAGWLQRVGSGSDGGQEFRVVHADGGERHVATTTRALRDADGEVCGWVGAVIDLTERDRLDAALRERAVAEEARHRQAEFLSRMSHELRTPLNAILGFGQLLETAAAPGEARRREFARHIVDSGRHMLALVEDLLAIQAIEQGTLQLALQPVAMPAMVASVVDLLAPQALAREVALVDGSAGAPDVRADPQRLRQVLLNLLSNAIKYNRRGGRAFVRVLQRTAADGSRRVHTVVEDEGPGLDERQRARLFTPFDRLGRRDAEGTGLGLLISRDLVRLMGGELVVDSVPGRGTTVTVELPAA